FNLLHEELYASHSLTLKARADRTPPSRFEAGLFPKEAARWGPTLSNYFQNRLTSVALSSNGSAALSQVRSFVSIYLREVSGKHQRQNGSLLHGESML